jgi:hypothetical protein
VGLEAVDRLRPLVPEGVTTAQIALRWIIDHLRSPWSSRRPQPAASGGTPVLAPLGDDVHAKITAIYDEPLRPHVHHRWYRRTCARIGCVGAGRTATGPLRSPMPARRCPAHMRASIRSLCRG